jgi:hypothetical protein
MRTSTLDFVQDAPSRERAATNRDNIRVCFIGLRRECHDQLSNSPNKMGKIIPFVHPKK